MIRFAIRALLARKLRTVLTGVAIVLGVSMVTGTYVLTDSISNAFQTIFSATYANTDAVITGKSAVGSDQNNNNSQTPTLSSSLLDKVQHSSSVNQAVGIVNGSAQLIGHDGKAISFGGAPNLGFNVRPDVPAFQTVELVSGAWPQSGQVVIDQSTATKKKFSSGQTIGVLGVGKVVTFTISGIIRYGKIATIGGATLAGFTTSDAQQLMGKIDQYDQILVSARTGVSAIGLRDALKKLLPATAQVLSAQEQAAQQAKDTDSFLSFFRTFLLVFAGVALFVGAFVIANSLSITIAQRTREFATLRTLGASRRQVLGTVLFEALAVGTLAALTGLALGVGLARGLFWMFDKFGLTLPNSGLLFRPRTAIVALLVGIVVTVAASLRPALRATRVPPIAAVREGATLPRTRFARFRTPGALVVTAIGFAMLAVGLFRKVLSTSGLLTLIGVGAVVVFIGLSAFSSLLVRPMAAALNPVARIAIFFFSVLVWPLSILYWLIRKALSRRNPNLADDFPSPLTEKSVVQIGGENSRRDPQRTASTAAALMIGLALITLVATLAAGLIKPFESAVDRIFVADYAIVSSNNFGGSGLPPAVARAASVTPGVETVVGVRGAEAKAFDKSTFLTALDPGASQVVSLSWAEGSQSVLDNLGSDGAFVDKNFAKNHNLQVGSPVTVLVPSGARVTFNVMGIFKPPSGGSPFGPITISSATFDAHFPKPTNIFAFAKVGGGVTKSNTAALEASLKSFPNAKVETRTQFKNDQINGIKGLLNVLYVLLALSVVVSIFGIVNNLVLTVFERTRELGMIRAIGMTLRQTRRMIRHESVVIALIGAILGIALGLAFVALRIARIDFLAWALPVGQLVNFAIVSVLVGIIAAIFPARRAARLKPLEALNYE